MMKIRKGQKASNNGVLLTNNEYNNYKKLLDCVQEFKQCKKAYDRRFNSYLM